MKTPLLIAPAVVALAGAVSTADAGLSTTDPGLIDGSVSSFVSARTRLDNDSSPTWKNAIITDSSNIGGPANQLGANSLTPIYDSDVTYDFSISYTVGTGAINLTVTGPAGLVESLDSTAAIPAGEELLAIRIDGSAPGGGVTTATIDSFTFAGAPGVVDYEYLNDFSASPASTRQFLVGDLLYLTDLLDSGETLTFNGTFTFDYDTSNPAGQRDERTSISVRLFAGTPIPAPSAVALLGLAGLAGVRRPR